MKKIFIMSFALMFGLNFQAIAADNVLPPSNEAGANQNGQSGVVNQEQNETVNQGENLQIQTQDQNNPEIQGAPMENTAQGQEPVRVENQGVDPQLQVQGQNNPEAPTVSNDQDQNNQNLVSNNSDIQLDMSSPEKRKNHVDAAIQSMIQVAEKNPGIGEEIKNIVQKQTQNRESIEKNIEKIEDRNGFVKFFIGPNYGEIKEARKNLAQNTMQIEEMNRIKSIFINLGDQDQLMNHLKVLEQANQEIRNLLSKEEKSISLFGWLIKMYM